MDIPDWKSFICFYLLYHILFAHGESRHNGDQVVGVAYKSRTCIETNTEKGPALFRTNAREGDLHVVPSLLLKHRFCRLNACTFGMASSNRELYLKTIEGRAIPPWPADNTIILWIQ